MPKGRSLRLLDPEAETLLVACGSGTGDYVGGLMLYRYLRSHLDQESIEDDRWLYRIGCLLLPRQHLVHDRVGHSAYNTE